MTTAASALPSGPRRPADAALAQLGHAVPAPDPADASAHSFPDGGTWRTEVPSVEGPEALATVFKEAGRLDVPIHRISQGSGVWMLTDAEITEMVESCAELGAELCLFTGPRGTWDIGGATRSDSGGGGLRARGHDAVAGCVEDALRAASLGVKCLLVADEGVLWLLHQLRERGELPADTTFKLSALVGPVNPGLVRGVRAAGRRLDQHPLGPDAGTPHRDPPGLPRPDGLLHRGPGRPRRLRTALRRGRVDPPRRPHLSEVRAQQVSGDLPLRRATAGRGAEQRARAGAPRPARARSARPAGRGRRAVAAGLPAAGAAAALPRHGGVGHVGHIRRSHRRGPQEVL
ncbi:LOW QUALITY PROTEIN: conserved hypothetical protein, partial [Streptomyces himastatinicus ATCC 53653]